MFLKCNVRKNIFWHVRPTKLQISAFTLSDQWPGLRCPHEETLQPWILKMHPLKILIRVGVRAGWSESSLGAPVWRYVSDVTGNVLSLVCWVSCIIDTLRFFSQGVFLFYAIQFEPVKYKDYEYPGWAHGIGAMMALSSVSIIPFYMIYLYFATPGNTMQVSIYVCLCFRLIADFVILCVISFQRQNKSKKKDCLWKQITHRITKRRDSVW